MEKNEEYIVSIMCSNCKTTRNTAIPCGKLVKDFLKDMLCDNCKCITRKIL